MNKASQQTDSDASHTVAEHSHLSNPSGLADSVVHPRRRRLLTGSVAGAGILLAMQAKTALGGGSGICQSPSAMLSGNLSHHPHGQDTCSGGRSPGFWKQPGNFTLWSVAGLNPPHFKTGVHISNCSNGLSQVSPCDMDVRGSMLSDGPFNASYGYGIWEVLVWPTSYPYATNVGQASCALTGGKGDVFGGQGQLLRHLSCAYLNAGSLNGPGNATGPYPITQSQVIAMWNAVKGGGWYCPTGPYTNTCKMSATDIINYISGMYDTGAGDNLEGCMKI